MFHRPTLEHWRFSNFLHKKQMAYPYSTRTELLYLLLALMQSCRQWLMHLYRTVANRLCILHATVAALPQTFRCLSRGKSPPCLFHKMTGTGDPCATHSKVTFWPCITSYSALSLCMKRGCVLVVGAETSGRKLDEIISNELYKFQTTNKTYHCLKISWKTSVNMEISNPFKTTIWNDRHIWSPTLSPIPEHVHWLSNCHVYTHTFLFPLPVTSCCIRNGVTSDESRFYHSNHTAIKPHSTTVVAREIKAREL